MAADSATPRSGLDRRLFLQTSVACLAAGAGANLAAQPAGKEKPVDRGKPTNFQIACMTLPYSQFPLERALTGLRSAGYKCVAWGTTHRENGGKPVPVLAGDAPPDKAKELGKKCRDLGLEPLMMFSGGSPDGKDGLEFFKSRIQQAAAAGLPHILTFSGTRGGDRKLWVERLKLLGPIARDRGVMIVVKQHGGLTASGVLCAQIIAEVNDPAVKVCYDSGNVMDYLKIDPLPDMQKCAAEVRSFCIKDHRKFPKDQDCGPGYGEIDHYRLLAPVAFTGLPMPLCCENISVPVLPRPTSAEGIDALARRAREFLEVVVQGLQA
jgi:sugar phosphate isomerase/epimerase